MTDLVEAAEKAKRLASSDDASDASSAHADKKAKKVAPRARAICFTYNNFNSTIEAELQKMVRMKYATYLVYQHEIAPDTGHEHLQGYVEYDVNRDMLYLSRMCGGKPHTERRKGSPRDAADYCKKAESRKPGTVFYEDGEISNPKPGNRRDLSHIKALIDKRATERELWEDDFTTTAKYYKAFNHYATRIAEERSRCTICICLWGASDSGKTTSVRRLFPNALWVDKGNGGVWYDLYEPNKHDTIVFDEFNGWIPFHQFKRMIDMSPFTLEVKGGTKIFRAKNVVFTSNTNPYEWYEILADKESEAFHAFDRRIHFNLEARKQTKLTSLGFREELDPKLYVHRSMLPWYADVREGFTLGGLTSGQWEMILTKQDHNLNALELKEILTSGPKPRGAGVILNPAPFEGKIFREGVQALLETYVVGPRGKTAALIPSGDRDPVFWDDGVEQKKAELKADLAKPPLERQKAFVDLSKDTPPASPAEEAAASFLATMPDDEYPDDDDIPEEGFVDPVTQNLLPVNIRQTQGKGAVAPLPAEYYSKLNDAERRAAAAEAKTNALQQQVNDLMAIIQKRDAPGKPAPIIPGQSAKRVNVVSAYSPTLGDTMLVDSDAFITKGKTKKIKPTPPTGPQSQPRQFATKAGVKKLNIPRH